eukprot:CAMPEP_0180156072 /NCGR_PEP_ID=MMETSP0986-20121125/25308_1 /TAXON_ID=697907 /ORGANISM="non described non described, Strain CCMP2293" /LENGTH=61 /DNA_ID=CAMNT_0022105091 /DNA_START=85 /DNA_END=270 /DNA_ORIENTATION=-
MFEEFARAASSSGSAPTTELFVWYPYVTAREEDSVKLGIPNLLADALAERRMDDKLTASRT